MKSINCVTVSGNIAGEPELRTPRILVFRLAVTRSRKNGDAWEEYPAFLDVKVFGNRAEPLSKILRVGQRVFVLGEIASEEWTDKQTGGKRSKIVIEAREIETPPKPKEQAAPESVYADEDIPF